MVITTKFSHDLFLDTGSTMALIAKDVVAKCQNTKGRRSIHTANRQPMSFVSTTNFKVRYDGQCSDIWALMTSQLDGDIFLGWCALQCLWIFPYNFPKTILTCNHSTRRRPTKPRWLERSSKPSKQNRRPLTLPYASQEFRTRRPNSLCRWGEGGGRDVTCLIFPSSAPPSSKFKLSLPSTK